MIFHFILDSNRMSFCLQHSESPAVCHFITNKMERKKKTEWRENEWKELFFFLAEAFQLHSSRHSLCLVLTVIFLSYNEHKRTQACVLIFKSYSIFNAIFIMLKWFFQCFFLSRMIVFVSNERQIWIKIVLMMSFQRRSPAIFFSLGKWWCFI